MEINNIIFRYEDGDFDLTCEGVPFRILKVMKGAVQFQYDGKVQTKLCKWEGDSAVIEMK